MNAVAVASVVAVAAFALGVVAAIPFRPERPAAGSAQSSSEPPPAAVTPTKLDRRESATKLFDRANGFLDLFERQRGLIEATATATARECQVLLLECAADDTMALQSIAARWAAIAPRDLLEFLLSDDGRAYRGDATVYGELFAVWGRCGCGRCVEGDLESPAEAARRLRTAARRPLALPQSGAGDANRC